ncbi:DUF4253 domain-containing protein [Anabaena sp. WFMT]|uniref:DUF4253 domain-containing protein n=1 Tax=Anabaena sp. WFMT TaxID=3449730 RepID=UPI003F27AAB2
MISEISNIKKLIKNTILEETQIIEVKIPETNEIALAMQVDIENKIEAWKIMRKLLSQTQRYPVIVACWFNPGENWADNVINNDLFCRFEYQQEPSYNQYQNSVFKGLIAQVDEINIQEFLNEKIEILLEEFNQNLAALEQQNPEDSFVDLSYLQWYEPINQPLVLLLLPIQNCWETLAYLHWYGASYIGSDKVMAMLKYWHEQYAIELVCHYGTMLQITVKNKPKTFKEALQLAIEQEAIAPCTTILPGISLQDHACALLKTDHWFLHERP